jgi:5-methylcytosine-specific restriction protein A
VPQRPPRYNPFAGRPRQPSPSEASRPTASQRGYDSRWQRARLSFLAEHPLCKRCSEMNPPRVTEATVVDHSIPHKGNQELFWNVDLWISLCEHCHNVKTANEDGGFGREVKPKPGTNGSN